MLMRMAMADIETTAQVKKFVIPKETICITSPGIVYEAAIYYDSNGPIYHSG